MARAVRSIPRLLLSFAVCALAGGACAGPSKSAAGDPHIHGAAHLHVRVEGAGVAAILVAPAATMVGFEHTPSTDQERSSLRLAIQNLKIGDAMIRLNAQAGCRLAKVKVSAPLTAAAPMVGSGDDAVDPEVDLSADYRFECAQPDRLDSAALGVFSGFPFLQRVLVDYRTKDGKGRAELTPNNPVVTFVPF